MALSPHNNRILSRLPQTELSRVEPMLETVTLAVRQRLEIPNKAIQHAYFIDHGVASVLATGSMRQSLNVALIGWEGCSGLPLVLGAARSPLDTFVQIQGIARRIAIADLQVLLPKCPELSALLLQAVFLLQLQVASTALANGHASLKQRLARCLLMAHDRLRGDEIALTHDCMAGLLGVRRPGVTGALATMRKSGVVDLKRGVVQVVDRQGLERLAGKYYGSPEAEMARLDGI